MTNLNHSFAKLFFNKYRLFFIKVMRIFSQSFSTFLVKFGYLIKYSKWLKSSPVEVDKNVHQNTMNKEKLDEEIDYLEFGVRHGRSFEWWVKNNKNPNSFFIGFDTFEGLPEGYGRFSEGDMSNLGETPQIDDSRHSFKKGLFQDTLPGFLKEYDLGTDRKKVIHVDCDLYSSSIFVLTYLAPYLKQDDVLIFDDFGSFSCPDHGFRAFIDFFHSYRIGYELICISNRYTVLSVKIK
jgi:hypothetical protein